MGRPKKTLSAADCAKVEALAKEGFTQDYIAHQLDMAPRTLRERLRDDAKVSAAYKKGRDDVLGRVERTAIQKALEGDNTMVCFVLKTQRNWREVQRIEHTGADGGPIETENTESPRDKLIDELDRLAERQPTRQTRQRANRRRN